VSGGGLEEADIMLVLIEASRVRRAICIGLVNTCTKQQVACKWSKKAVP
jgi:hypothetical protein